MILDEDEDNATRVSAAVHLRASGFDVAEAKHVAEALHILHHRAVDIVLCDVTVPGLFSGLALMRWVREHRPAIKRIVTADSKAILAGAEGYGLFLSKPYRLADLDVDH